MIVKPPKKCKTVFLAGTIDNGNSIDWQTHISNKVHEICDDEIIFYNPRREDWDTTWGENSKELINQINWELDHLEKCDLIVMKLLSNSKSPISLLEIGLFSKSNKLVVLCEKGFYRYTNVKIVCDRYGITMVNNEKELIDVIIY